MEVILLLVIAVMLVVLAVKAGKKLRGKLGLTIDEFWLMIVTPIVVVYTVVLAIEGASMMRWIFVLSIYLLIVMTVVRVYRNRMA
ncbi:hypothetical protein CR205_03040 [Alteribacter lacisalsi]|uniref:Uncharacterized protein n=1 Tax=Alteribacter lacisalsi TaxID=2045244 RepID=A0A2W0HJA1_9BACI|nr:hypothetical protein [Alteribacter lacisalsi]PYZ97585.1 hypothetical protein CR205_03040 [Alteribacter lacisalsi]